MTRGYGALSDLRHLAAIALVASAFVACSGPYEVLSEAPLSPQKSAKGFVVFPVGGNLHGDRGLESIARTHDITAWLLTHTEVPIVGPFDYKLFNEVEDARVVSTATDLMTRDQDRVDINGWIAVRLLVTENRATNVRDIVDNRKGSKTEGKTFRQYGVEATVRVEAQLFDALRGKELAKAVVQGMDDPTQVPSEGEPRPKVRMLIRKALAIAFEDHEGLLDAVPRRRVRGEPFVASVPAMARWSAPGRVPFMKKLEKKDEMDRDAALVGLWDRFRPGLNVRATTFATKQPGVLVTKAARGLQKNDVILAVGGRAVRAPYQLDRRLQACGGAGCEATVYRAFNQVKVHLALPAVPRPEEDG